MIIEMSGLPKLKMKAVKGLDEIYANLAGYAVKYKKPNVVLTGDTGTGKTYALTYLGTELIENKKFPLYTTAFGLVDRFKKFVFERDELAFRELLEVEVLLIDDLGTEPRIPNITDENLYNLINERLLAKRSFVISTNLSPAQLIDRYGERIAGRILAKETTSVVKFDGKDMRLS
ncbi:MAG: ATP-binding protein [Firmicutes bacterium]|nr:ATP-binding protein [Bacillota bacterium]